MSHLKLVKAGKETHTVVDTLEITPKQLQEWEAPPFQRPLRVNGRVLELAEDFKKNGGVFPGVLTIGLLKNRKYIVDGQHRVHAFVLSELPMGYADVRFREYASMDAMAEDFVQLNSVIVRMRPDDILRGLEGSSDSLTAIRKHCPYVGYDFIRRNANTSPILSMSALLRCWTAASKDCPGSGGVHASAVELPKMLTRDDADQICSFLDIAFKAWGRDAEYAKLWSGLNLTLCMWLYRHMVLQAWSQRVPKLSRDHFVKCLQSMSASSDYLDWLVGRSLTDKDRGPAYSRIRRIFVTRLHQETKTKVFMPQPEWSPTH